MKNDAPAPPTRPEDALAEKLRGFGPIGLLAILAILSANGIFAPLSALLVLWWAQGSRTPWAEIGYVRPESWPMTWAVGLLFGSVLKIAIKAIVMPLLGADPINPTYHYLVGNTAALPGILLAVIVGAGFGEETLFRGYLFERLGKLLGSRPLAKASIVLLTSAWFGVVHFTDQGVAGVQQATIVGLVFGTIFARTGQLPMLMVAHAAFDLTAVAIIYWDLESTVARWFWGS